MVDLNRLQWKFANKSREYWAKIRSNMRMAARSNIVSELAYERLREELSDILDSGVLTYPHTLEQLNITDDMTYSERMKAFDLKPFKARHDTNQLKFVKDMDFKAQAIRKSNWSWRIGEEAEQLQSEGWCPFFVTLTVDPLKADPKRLWMEGRELRKYIRRLANVVCKEMGHPPSHKPPYRPESNYIRYAGVIEHGKSREHHHGHFIVWLRRIPSSWSVCPNAGIRNPERRTKNECLPMRTYWTWSLPGLSKALYFRSIGDIWETKFNFVLPMDEKSGQPMRVSVPRVAGAYITKYLSKEHKEWHHRMKATRNLGMTKLRQVVSELQNPVVEALTWRAKTSQLNTSLMTMSSVPLGLLRSVAKRQDYFNKFSLNQMDLRMLLQSNYGIFTKMLRSVKAGARPDRMGSLDYFDWVGQLLPAQPGYSEQRQIAAHAAIGIQFPPIKKISNHVKIGANERGHP